MDDIQQKLAHTEQAMHKAYTHTQVELAKFNAGRATPNMLDKVLVDYYGKATPIQQMASISTPDAKTFVIKPWDKSHIPIIEKAILSNNLALTPQNDGELIRITMPVITEERRREIVKQVKNEGEKGKVALRNIRKETKDALKRLKKEGISEDTIKKAEEALQKLTDQYVDKIEQLIAHKEAEIIKV